ncbi:PepSY domain-containing protein [Pseudogracilibacillus auburnensis]|uniref:PepSY domain-containing protein n=1 Tax=Pseudogracilibacillus auburnensis TaxID=1494959 RepID=UPI001A96020F|nr:PepSY domain-containing protein [Pseudogracilibacillus auburnensis]MBO1003328.1 PepSY domain-containing protein [Pseudogracilibacillus auburnensis]
MKNRMKKYLIPILATTVVIGGGYKIVNAANQESAPAITEEGEQAEITQQDIIKEDEATKIALEQVPGTVKKVELDDENGSLVYEFEIISGDGQEFDVKIDALTTTVLKVEADDIDDDADDEKEEAALAKQVKVTKEEATKIALEEVPGTVKEMELDDEDHLFVFEFEILSKDGKEYDVKIDAQTGKVMKVELDDEDQEDED